MEICAKDLKQFGYNSEQSRSIITTLIRENVPYVSQLPEGTTNLRLSTRYLDIDVCINTLTRIIQENRVPWIKNHIEHKKKILEALIEIKKIKN
jgi:DNA polymerase sigma